MTTSIRDLVQQRRHLVEQPLVDFLGREVQSENLQEVHRVLSDLGTEMGALDDESRGELGHPYKSIEEHPDRLGVRQISELGGHELLPRVAVAAHPHRQHLKRVAFALTLLAVAHGVATYARRPVPA